MGRLLNGINGPIIGKIGHAIGSSWNGIPYVKGPYKKRTKKVSKKELANRSKFRAAQFWLKPLTEFVRQGFKRYSLKNYGFNAAKSYLLRNAFEGVQPDIYINPAKVKVSFGNLPLPENISVARIAPGELLFTWNPAPVKDGSSYDQAMLLAYDIKDAKAYYKLTGQFRKDGVDKLTIAHKEGRVYHVYIAFVAADRSRQSDSLYLGTIS